MSMFAYRASMFMVFFDYAMLIVNGLIAPAIFPDTVSGVTPWAGQILSGTDIFAKLSGGDTIQILALTAGVLALFAFSLLVPTIPFVFTFFMLTGFVTNSYIGQLNLPPLIEAPIIMGIQITFFVGASQYAARSTFQGS